jgi:hypothetical protein
MLQGLCDVPLRRPAGSEVWCQSFDVDEVNVAPMSGKILSGRCCLGMVVLVVPGGAAEMLPDSSSFLLPLQRTHPPPFLFFTCLSRVGRNLAQHLDG